MEKEKRKMLDQIANKREEIMTWWEKPLNQLDFTQTNKCSGKSENGIEK